MEEKDILRVDEFIINTTIIGSGAYVIVFLGTGPKKQKIAAKRINGKLPRILREDVSKLTQLNHNNIVKIFRFHQQDETFWLFMEFCSHGDLNQRSAVVPKDYPNVWNCKRNQLPAQQ